MESNHASIIDSVFGNDGVFAKAFTGYEARPGQVSIAHTIHEAIQSEADAICEGPCGCHVAGQPILMYDGTIKVVEDVVVGDVLMGPDGTPRNVLALARGRQETADIVPVKGDPWRVNMDHILTLVRYDTGKVCDVRVRDYLAWSQHQKNVNKLFRVPVRSFGGTHTPVPFDPYMLGLVLGDGNVTATNGVIGIAPYNHEVRDAARVWAETNVARLKDLGWLSTHRYVPTTYKTAAWDDRRQILAGILDAEGTLTARNGYEYTSVSKTLVEDVAFLARSLGLAAYVSLCPKSGQGRVAGASHRVSISGEISSIPCRIPRNQAKPRPQVGSVLRTGLKVKPTGIVEDYYGFSLDGDQRYLLGDFTVTHNTGKSVAYIVPAVFAAASQKKRIVIATANIALQEQLIKKDLPDMAKILPWNFTYALLKGVGNYACLDKVNKSDAIGMERGLFKTNDLLDEFSRIHQWVRETSTGDKSELDFEPSYAAWNLASTTTDDCMGNECTQSESCFVLSARKKAMQADIIVTNYHMLFAHLAIIGETGGQGVLPKFDVLIMDEAHEAANIAREFFGMNLASRGVEAIATQLKSITQDTLLADQLRLDTGAFFSAVTVYAKSPSLYKTRLKEKNFVDTTNVLSTLNRCAAKAKEALDATPKEERARFKRADLLWRRCLNARSGIEEFVGMTDPDKVYYIELGDNASVRLRSKVIFTGPVLEAALYNSPDIKTVVAISATVTTGNPESKSAFDFIRKELGAPETALTCIGASPFDFAKQALVVIPVNIPLPKAPTTNEHQRAVAQTTNDVVKMMGGKTLGLFTSYRNLNATHEAVKWCGHRVLKQGDLPRTELTRVFREDVNSVLLGTDSFWTGVDVPGESLSCVIIDKLPFTPPDDPVADAINERLKNAFIEYMVPVAVIKLRQGFGRLIRTQKDVGVAVILDPRVRTTQWGMSFFWSSFPKTINGRDNIQCIPQFMAWARSQVPA